MATLNGKAKGAAGAKKLVIKPLKRERDHWGFWGRPVALWGSCIPPLLLCGPCRAPRAHRDAICGHNPTTEQPKLPENFERDTWAKLEDAVDAVHCKRTVACSLEELYRVRCTRHGLLMPPNRSQLPTQCRRQAAGAPAAQPSSGGRAWPGEGADQGM
jgi:hypothetical protein